MKMTEARVLNKVWSDPWGYEHAPKRTCPSLRYQLPLDSRSEDGCWYLWLTWAVTRYATARTRRLPACTPQSNTGLFTHTQNDLAATTSPHHGNKSH